MAEQPKYVYDFSEGSREMRDLLGGKGANLAEMTQVLGQDRVPAGFTVTTEACVAYMDAGGEKPPGLDGQVDEALDTLDAWSCASAMPRIRCWSGSFAARVSMPACSTPFSTLGSITAPCRPRGDDGPTSASRANSDRRLVQMFGNVVRGIPGDRYEDAIAEVKRKRGVELDTELDVDDLKEAHRSVP